MSTTTTTPTTTVDVAVVGGGPAGLSAAVTLARSLRSVLVIDGGEPRNAPSDGAHHVLGREGVSPAELLRAGRAEAAGYGAGFRDTTVLAVARDGEGFRLDLADDSVVRARRLLLTTGLVDELPDVPGVRERWGASVLHCPFCHGYEVRGQRLGVLAASPLSAHQILLFAQLSDDVTVFLHAGYEPDEAAREQLAALGARVESRGVVGLHGPGRTLSEVELADGSRVGIDALVVAPRFVARADLYERLGGTLEENPMGRYVPTQAPMGRTPVPGVFAAGNVADLSATVAVSAGAGVTIGGAIHGELAMTDLAAEVERRRELAAGGG